ncbi:hypothetical protein BSPA111_15840 [Buttiauxella sp. A111]|nr:hypothetical protein BSPA111_15840 [Buttiauxella sp. A111]
MPLTLTLSPRRGNYSVFPLVSLERESLDFPPRPPGEGRGEGKIRSQPVRETSSAFHTQGE